EEILLLAAQRRGDRADIDVAQQLEESDGLVAQRLERAEQRRLVIEAIPVVADEYRRDAERHAIGALDHEQGRRGVPCGIATGLERRAHATRGERAGIRLAL